MEFQQIDGVQVFLNDLILAPGVNTGDPNAFAFAYFITIENGSDQEIQIHGRKWIVEERYEPAIIVEGDGVVGERPVIAPGESFTYNSFHVAKKLAEVFGAFYGRTESGVPFWVEIPGFSLEPPTY